MVEARGGNGHRGTYVSGSRAHGEPEPELALQLRMRQAESDERRRRRKDGERGSWPG